MHLIRITAPTKLPVALDEMKLHLRVDHDEDDAMIEGFIRAATERLEGRDGLLGCCFINQTWKMTLDSFASVITLPLPPCQSVTSISYVDANAATLTVDAAAYAVVGIGSIRSATLAPVSAWPASYGPVSITFVTGFSPEPSDIPEPVRASIKMTAANLYENRESVIVGSITSTLPDGAEALIRNFRHWEF